MRAYPDPTPNIPTLDLERSRSTTHTIVDLFWLIYWLECTTKHFASLPDDAGPTVHPLPHTCI